MSERVRVTIDLEVDDTENESGFAAGAISYEIRQVGESPEHTAESGVEAVMTDAMVGVNEALGEIGAPEWVITGIAVEVLG